jgi:hypothetical protein
MNLYCIHVDNVLTDSLEKIEIIDSEDKDKVLEEKDISQVIAKYPYDLFKTIFMVIDLLAEGIKGKLLYELFRVIISL